ncbi:MAG: hypothetical protein FWD89_00495 [Firmicutes bacterium]|nr:hypothetical protein [Bacillota bacterium]MCL2770778.1 hypothetical protein [Bacillota bacterium]
MHKLNSGGQMKYIRCPRCELNYIQKKDKLCGVCKGELKISGGEEFNELEADYEICPLCKINYITTDEDMCASCAKERSIELESDDFIDREWKKYINDEDEDEVVKETENLRVADYHDEEEEEEEDEDGIDIGELALDDEDFDDEAEGELDIEGLADDFEDEEFEDEEDEDEEEEEDEE